MTVAITFILLNQYIKTIPKCDISFAIGELREACGHMTMMNCDQQMVIGRWQVVDSSISVHTVELLLYADRFLELFCFTMAFSVCYLNST